MNKDHSTGPAGNDPQPPVIDVAVVRHRPLPWLPWVLSGLADLVAVAVLLAYPGDRVGALAALLAHAAAAVPLAASNALSRSERALAATLVLTLPLVGLAVSALALGTVGRAEIIQQPPGEALPPEPPDPEDVRRMAEALPCCEALLHGALEERRAVLATLTRRADADAVALLRWALGAPDADLAVEAALALEDISATFEGRLAVRAPRGGRAPVARGGHGGGRRGRARHRRRHRRSLADPDAGPRGARALREGGGAGPAAPGRGRAGAREARAPGAAPGHRAGLHRRGAADGFARDAAGARRVREEAVLASHVLPWEGPSALATYRPAMPPPLTARRRLVRGTGSISRGTGPPAPRPQREHRHGAGSRGTGRLPHVGRAETPTIPKLTLVGKERGAP